MMMGSLQPVLISEQDRHCPNALSCGWGAFHPPHLALNQTATLHASYTGSVMVQRIAIIQGHPDPGKRFCRALGEAYASGAQEAGLEVKLIDVAQLGISFLRTQAEFETGEPPPPIAEAQEVIRWADHLLII